MLAGASATRWLALVAVVCLPIVTAVRLEGEAARSLRSHARRVNYTALADEEGARAADGALATSRHSQGSCAGRSTGKPTDYAFAGCYANVKPAGKIDMGPLVGLTLGRCYTLCKENKARPGWFGLMKGEQCYCASHFDATEVDQSKCDFPCEGDDREMCGGFDTVSMYVMFDCTPPTAAEIAADAADKKKIMLNSYSKIPVQKCGEAVGNALKIDGSESLAGSVDDCKAKCATGYECHGFTYDKSAKQCKFKYDAKDGMQTMKANLKLKDVGEGGCAKTRSKKCEQCQGACKNNDDCAPGLECHLTGAAPRECSQWADAVKDQGYCYLKGNAHDNSDCYFKRN